MRTSVLLIFVHLMKLRGYRCLFVIHGSWALGAMSGTGTRTRTRASAGTSVGADRNAEAGAGAGAGAGASMRSGAGAGVGAYARSEAGSCARVVLIKSGLILIAGPRITALNCCQYTVFANFEDFNEYRRMDKYPENKFHSTCQNIGVSPGNYRKS